MYSFMLDCSSAMDGPVGAPIFHSVALRRSFYFSWLLGKVRIRVKNRSSALITKQSDTFFRTEIFQLPKSLCK